MVIARKRLIVQSNLDNIKDGCIAYCWNNDGSDVWKRGLGRERGNMPDNARLIRVLPVMKCDKDISFKCLLI